MATAKQSDPQAKVNEDKSKVPDASESAKARGAEKGDVDVVKAQEKDAKDRDDAAQNARDEEAKRVEQAKKDQDEADKAKFEADKKAADAKGQPEPAVQKDFASARDGVDLVNKDWTVQSDRPYYDYQPQVGQAFVKAQLPDPEVQRAAGVDPEAYKAGLVVLDDDDATNDVVSGPEPWESRDLGLVKN